MLNVAVGVISNKAGDILISRRAENAHQGGLWEFPGGKFEGEEGVFEALQRELQEELGILITKARPLITIFHDYGDKKVCLHVMQVASYDGIPTGLEAQPVKWVSSANLPQYAFPVANKPIIKAISLADFYPIVDSCIGDEVKMLEHLDDLIRRGYTQIQLRAKALNKGAFMGLALRAIPLCKRNDVTLFLNTSLEMALLLKAEAVHLDSTNILALKKPIDDLEMKVAVSCHNLADLEKAKELRVCFAVLSPVCQTASHPGATGLGWETFGKLVSQATLPVYALGGLRPSNLEESWQYGAQGVSGIRKF